MDAIALAGRTVSNQMKIFLPLFLIPIIIPTNAVYARAEHPTPGTRAMAMGGAFVALGDDASTIFINAAGAVLAESIIMYGEYSERTGGEELYEAGFAALLPARGTMLCFGYYRMGEGEGFSRDIVVAGAARKLLDGIGGTFLSVGADVRFGRVMCDLACECSPGNYSESDFTGDIGVIIKPLPVLSLGASWRNIRETSFDGCGESVEWDKTGRYGLSYFWEDKVVISYEVERSQGRFIHHHGFSLTTDTPLEIMAGISDEKVSGGLGWHTNRLMAAVSFAAAGDGRIFVRTTVELRFN